MRRCILKRNREDGNETKRRSALLETRLDELSVGVHVLEFASLDTEAGGSGEINAPNEENDHNEQTRSSFLLLRGRGRVLG